MAGDMGKHDNGIADVIFELQWCKYSRTSASGVCISIYHLATEPLEVLLWHPTMTLYILTPPDGDLPSGLHTGHFCQTKSA